MTKLGIKQGSEYYSWVHNKAPLSHLVPARLFLCYWRILCTFSRSLEVLCHGISKLNATLEDESTKDRLVILMKSVVSPLLSRIFATEPSATPGELLGRGINRISEIIGDNLSNEEKSKIAHFVWKEFQKIIASNAEQGDVYIALLQMADLFVKLDIDEEKAESFLWVDSFLKRWIHCVQYDLMKFSRMQALMHLNFVLIALKNGKYDIIHEQKRRWSNVLRGTKSFINDKQMEKLKKYVGQIPVTNELYENLVEEFNLLLK
uniref:Uncharacterized protein n=1 Tax=Romanomermis culicivorax TaxID=13658 RepID=A0A915I2I5_ROMCU